MTRAETRRIASIAALVNGAIVVLLPLLLSILAGALSADMYDLSSTVRADNAPGVFAASVRLWREMLPALMLLAFIAGWRTFVHAARAWERGRLAWRGVAEAGACGFGCALFVLSPAILRRPLDSPPFVFTYGVMGTAVGLVVGLLLQTATWAVLRWRREHDATRLP